MRRTTSVERKGLLIARRREARPATHSGDRPRRGLTLGGTCRSEPRKEPFGHDFQTPSAPPMNTDALRAATYKSGAARPWATLCASHTLIRTPLDADVEIDALNALPAPSRACLPDPSSPERRYRPGQGGVCGSSSADAMSRTSAGPVRDPRTRPTVADRMRAEPGMWPPQALAALCPLPAD